MAESGGASMSMSGGVINFVGNIIQQGSFMNDTSVTSPVGNFASSLLAGIKQLIGHTHPAGTPPGDTGPNN